MLNQPEEVPAAEPYGVITDGPAVNVRAVPQIGDNIIKIYEQGIKFPVEGQIEGQNVLNNNIWYKIKDLQAYVWSGRVELVIPQDSTPTPTSPPQDTPKAVTQSQARAAQVLTDAMPTLKTKDGQLFGNEEGMAREMVQEWPSYMQLIIDSQKQKSILDKILSLIGLGH